MDLGRKEKLQLIKVKYPKITVPSLVSVHVQYVPLPRSCSLLLFMARGQRDVHVETVYVHHKTITKKGEILFKMGFG